MSMIPAQPDNGPAEVGTATVPADAGRLEHAWTWVTAQIDSVPAWSWAIALGVLTLATIVLIPVLQTQSFKAGQRAAGKKAPTSEDRKDRRLLIGALIPTTLFWIAVLIGSGRGLIAFGRDDLNWTGGWEILVPATLDGVAISFGLLAFRAIRKKRSPDRAVRIAASAMIASSAINFLHEVGGSALGAAYLAILSLLGMLIFDELLAQFEEGAAYIKRLNPKFGLRWFTWPTNTACAWFAWRNYPPIEGTDASVRVAVRHLTAVRRLKAKLRAETVDAPAWWMLFAPWVRIGQIRTALASQRSLLAEQDERTAVLADRLEDALTALSESRAAVTDLGARLETVNTSLDRLAQDAVNERNELTARLTAEKDETVRQLTEDFAAQLTEARAAASTVNLDSYRTDRSKTSPPTKRETSPRPGNRPAVSDEDAVQMMLTAHGDPDFEWSQNAVRTLTGAGFPRIPKLIAAWFTAAVEAAGEAKAVSR
jgi:hypothetical protein